MAVIDKETGKPVDIDRGIIYKETDTEALVYMFGHLMGVLHEKGILTDQDVIDLIPGGFRWYEVSE